MYTDYMAHKLGVNVDKGETKDVIVNGQWLEIDEEEIK